MIYKGREESEFECLGESGQFIGPGPVTYNLDLR